MTNGPHSYLPYIHTATTDDIFTEINIMLIYLYFNHSDLIA